MAVIPIKLGRPNIVDLTGIPACRQGSADVEVRRIELLSKHILQKLSTCLFCFIFFGKQLETNNRLLP